MMPEEIKMRILSNNKFLITSHINPEGDSIGSQLALYSLLKKLKKEAVIVNESPLPSYLSFLPKSQAISKDIPKDFDFEIVFVLDSPDMSRIGNVAKFITPQKTIINIDHHISNENFGISWVDTGFSSTGEMIFYLFKELNVQIDLEEGFSLYVAIVTDTGNFRYKNVTKRTFEIASELLSLGIRPNEIYERLFESYSISDTKLLGLAAQTLKVTEDGRIAWIWVTKEMLKETKASLEGEERMIDLGRTLAGVEIVILFRETGTENRIRVSFRSKGRVDVNKLASFFEGGGHTTASGCTVFGRKEEIERKIIEKAVELVREGKDEH